MSTALPELAALEIVDRLENITVAGGYNYTCESVVRPRRLTGDDVVPEHLRLVVLQGSAEEADEDLAGTGGGEIKPVDYHFTIVAYIIVSDTDTTPFATYVNGLSADIEKALSSSGAAWVAFNAGGLNAHLGPAELFQDEAGVEGFSRDLRITIRHRAGDLYTAR